MRTQIAFGGNSSDLNSRRMRSEIINGYFQTDKKGEFKRIRRAQGLKPYVQVGEGPIRGMLAVRGELFIVSGTELYTVDQFREATFLGDVGGAGNISYMAINGTEARQLIVVSGENGFIWDGTLFQQITDPTFIPDVSVATLDQKFYLNQPDSNIFFRSEVADGLNYNPIDQASAESNPDEIRFIVSKKTNLWIFGAKSVEYWQTDTSKDIGVSRVTSGTISRGLAAKFSVAEYEEDIFWLADDLTVWRISGTSAGKISDLNFELAIRGDGTASLPGYTSINGAEGFFIDHPTHKMYCLTFPGDGITWVYDLITGLWHKRSTRSVRRWRARLSQLFDNLIIVGDFTTNDLYILSEEQCDIDGDPQDFIITTPPIYGDDSGITVSEVELIADFTRSDDRQIILSASKDGGRTFKTHRQLSFGNIGDSLHRAISRQFGYTPRHKEFVTRWTVTDEAPIDIYELWADVEKGV